MSQHEQKHRASYVILTHGVTYAQERVKVRRSWFQAHIFVWCSGVMY